MPAFVSASFGAPVRARAAVRHACSLNRDGNDGVDEAFDDPPSTEEHLFDPASFLDDEDAEDGRPRLRRRRRGARRGPLRRHQLVPLPRRAHRPEGRLRGRAGLERRRLRGRRARRRHLRARRLRRRRARPTRTRWPPPSRRGSDAMPGGAAEVHRGRRPPGARGVRPRRGPRPGAHRPLARRRCSSPTSGATSWPTRRRCSTPTRSRCYAQTVIDGLTYEEITDPDGTAFAGDGFQDSLDRRLRGLPA